MEAKQKQEMLENIKADTSAVLNSS